MLFADIRLDLHPVAQQTVDLAVGIVQRLAAAKRRSFAQLKQHLADNLVAVALALKPIGQQHLLDVAVALAVLPIAEVGVAQRVLEEADDALMGEAFPLANATHRSLRQSPSARS